MRTKVILLLSVGLPTLLAAADARGADVAAQARQAGRIEPASCLRWVWQQYSWYDDCWASRYPYIGRTVVRIGRR